MRATLLALALATTAVSAAGEQVRSFNEEFDATGLTAVRVEFPIGEVDIEGTDTDVVRAEIVLECSRSWGSSSCEERAERVHLDSDVVGDRLALEVDGYSKWRSRGLSVRLRLSVPETMAVNLDMQIGEVDVRGVRGDTEVDLGIGEVTVRMDDADVESVTMDTGIGEASLRAPGYSTGSAGLFTRAVRWDEGAGRARIRIDLGIGEINVRLS